MTNKPNIDLWRESGYRLFAYEGPDGLKIERLARMVGKNKSSFYHHFADREVFTTTLMNYHVQQSKIVAGKEAECRHPEELIQVLVDHKVDLLFNRQLRVHRENPEFARCFTAVTTFSIPAIMPVWKEIVGLHENSYLAELVLRLTLENFFLQITDKTLNPDWLRHYFGGVAGLVKQFQRSPSMPAPDGTV